MDIELWTPEFVPIDAEPGEEIRIQSFLTPQWGDVTPFALESGDELRPVAPEPFLLVEGEVDLEAQTITLASTGEVLSITRDLIGDVINPGFIEQAEDIVDVSANLTDEEKLVAEFWEDGGGTSFPPGTWMTFGEFVSARDDIFFASSGDRFIGQDGDDTFFVVTGGDNLFTGGDGADAFWISTGLLPSEANVITDFDLEEDVIGLGGLGITSVNRLEISQVGDDVAITFSGSELAVLQNVQTSDLEANAKLALA